MSNIPAKGADGATYPLALPQLGSTPAAGALSVIPSPDGTHAKTADITALSTAITGALAATQVVSVTGTVAVTQSGSWTVALAPNATVALAGGNTVALKVDGSAVTQPVSFAAGAAVGLASGATVGLAAGTAAIGSITNLFALDTTITARLGTLGQKVSAASAPVVIASDQSAIPTAPVADELRHGTVGSDSKRVTAAPTLTPGTYATGKCLGGLVTLSSLLRVAGKSATVQSATVHAKVANTSAIDVVLFRAAPTVTTGLTDNATFAVDPADFDKVSKVLSFTTWNSLGTPSLSRLDGIGALLSAAGGVDLQAILVARGSVAISNATDLSIGFGVYQD